MFDPFLPPDHPRSRDYRSRRDEDLLQHIRSQKSLDDTLVAVADLSSEALDEVGDVYNLLIAAVRKR